MIRGSVTVLGISAEVNINIGNEGLEFSVAGSLFKIVEANMTVKAPYSAKMSLANAAFSVCKVKLFSFMVIYLWLYIYDYIFMVIYLCLYIVLLYLYLNFYIYIRFFILCFMCELCPFSFYPFHNCFVLQILTKELISCLHNPIIWG